MLEINDYEFLRLSFLLRRMTGVTPDPELDIPDLRRLVLEARKSYGDTIYKEAEDSFSQLGYTHPGQT